MGNGLEFNNLGIDTFDASSGVGNAFLNRGTSTISDETGELLFYSNGNIVWDSTHSVMFGGSGLLGSKFCTQSSIIIPWPLSPSRYFLFVQDSLASPNGLHHYMIDMSLNGGLGQVFPGPTQVLDTATEKLCATMHANDRDFWVVAHRWNSDKFYAYKVDPSGVSTTPVISSVGTVHTGLLNGTKGQMKLSPDGSKLALGSFALDFVELFDFDNETGVVSNPLTLSTGPNNKPMGVEFSADSKKLYYSQSFSSSPSAQLFQYDLDHSHSDCLLASEVAIATPDPLKIMGDLQLGLDKKIYVAYELPLNSNKTLGVINEPELQGLASNFQETGGPLVSNGRLTMGLTNFVSSFLSDGIFIETGTNCLGSNTVFWPEDTADVDSVRWVFGDAGATGTGVPAMHVFSSADTFTVTLYRYEGTVIDTFTRSVVIWDVNSNLIGNDTTICNGIAITLDASWYDACIEWSTGSTMSTISVNAAGTYWADVFYHSCVFRDSVEVITVSAPPIVDLGNDTSICAGANFEIDPDLPNAFYTWQDGSHDTTFSVTATGTYWLEATNACGSASDTMNVSLDLAAQPVLSFPDDTITCDAIPLVFDVTFSMANYTWSDGDDSPIKTITTSGIYWVEVGNSCDTVADTVNVTIRSPYISALGARRLLCDDLDTLRLIAVTNGDSALWSTGNSNDTLKIAQSGTYSYRIENVCGVLRDTVTVDQWDSLYQLSIGADTTICAIGDTLLIGPTDSNAFSFDYAWSNGASSQQIAATEEGVYTVTASNKCAVLSATQRVLLASLLEIDPLTEINVCEGESIELSIPEVAENVTWFAGNNERQLSVNQAGIYIATITDSNGCKFIDSVQIFSACAVRVFTPNVFTPNGDALNDEFCIEYENVRSVNVQIYNRWGARVFESDDKTLCWDGKTSGTSVHEGVYYYLIEGEGTDDEPFSFRGSLTLFP